MASDSTCAIIALWRLCVPVGLGPQEGHVVVRVRLLVLVRSDGSCARLNSAVQVGGDGAIPVDVLKAASREQQQLRILQRAGCSGARAAWPFG